jgi:hypothetical protein
MGKMKVETNKTMGDRVVFCCQSCDSIGKVYVECWTEKSDGPYKIDLVEHDLTGAIKVDEIQIVNKPGGKELRFYHCGDCGRILGHPQDIDFLCALDRFNPLSPKN